jgi:hypothetical protein
MKAKLLFLVTLMLVGVQAQAQESYSLNVTAQQVTDLTAVIDMTNGQTCIRWGLAVGCTQAQACTAASAAGGSSCTAAQARAAKARIFPQTLAGREEFVTHMIAVARFIELRDQVPAWLEERKCAHRATLDQTARNTQCTNNGLTAPCRLCGIP